MKRVYIVLIVLVITASVLILTPRITDKATQKESIKIGAAFGFTGLASQWAEMDLRGAKMAVDEANEKDGINGKKIELLVEDTQSDNVKTISAVMKLINVDKVQIIIGPTWLDVFRSAAPLADDNKVVFISPSASITAVKDIGNYNYVFSTWYRNDKESEELVKHFASRNFRKIALVSSSDAYCEDLNKQITKHMKMQDAEIITYYRYNQGENDFRTQLIKLKDSEPDAIVFCVDSEQSLLSFFQQQKILYPEAKIYTAEWIEEFARNENFKGLLENVSYVTPVTIKNEFTEKYRRLYSSEPYFSASTSYDAMNIIIEAMKSGARNGEEIRNFLTKSSFVTETFGDVKFDDMGGISGGRFEIRKIRNGAFVKIE